MINYFIEELLEIFIKELKYSEFNSELIKIKIKGREIKFTIIIN